jgi:hypothetical protein
MTNQPPDGIVPASHDIESPGPLPAAAAPDTAVQLERPARALLGWMPTELGERALLSNRLGVGPTGEQRERARLAREAVAARPAGADQQHLVAAPPPELAEHVERLRAQRASAAMFTEGWDIALVDLTRVCAFQPWVFADSAVERVQEVKPEDVRSIATVTLPTDQSTIVRAQFDQAKQAFVIASPNPNLKVTGSFAMMVQEAQAPGYVFTVNVMPSFVQVARFQGRYFLRDGYHRAFGLLDRGVTHAPVFLRDFDAVENLAPPGMLPQAAYLGDRPPLLRDYHDELVAASVRLPAHQKMIVIQALELSVQG